MWRRILVFNLRLLLAWFATAIVVLPIHHFAQSSEKAARHWKMPAFALVFAIVFALMFVASFRVFRPSLQWPRRIVGALTVASTLAVLAFVLVPFLFGSLWLGVWLNSDGDRVVPRTEIPANATHLDLSCTAVLDRFQGSRKALLERYLASSAAWQVTDEDGRRVALRRLFRGGHWQTELNMYFTEPDPNSTFAPQAQSSHRTRIFLDGAAQTPDLIRHDHAEARVGAPSVEVPLVFNHYEVGHYQSRLWIRGTDMALDIDEGSDTMPRDLTRARLSEICTELNRLDSQESSLGIDGLLPEGSIAPSESFSVEDDGQPGIYQAVGYVNPSQQGFVYVRAFDARSGSRLSKTETRKKREYTGWSSVSSRHYYFRVQFFIDEGDWQHMYPARFELWFHPDDGSPERRLMAKERSINGWER
jgi:hypothetical protein